MASKKTGTGGLPAQSKGAPSPAGQQQPPRSSPSPPPLTMDDLKTALEQQTSKFESIVDQSVSKFETIVDHKNSELLENISTMFQGFVEQVDRLDKRVDGVVEKVEKIEGNMVNPEIVEKALNEIEMIQFREMEFVIRIRGLKENTQENLKDEIAVALVQVLNCEYDTIISEIEKAFRVSTLFAQQRNLPRDVVVYFTRKARRNEIMQAYYHQKFAIAGQNVIILKEIPSKILKRRKEFKFLSQELNNRQISFRWEIPIGLVVTYEETRYRIHTVQQARDFYKNILKIESCSTSQSHSEEALDVDKSEDKRMTRATFRRLEQEQAGTSALQSSQPVGGARSKTLADLRKKVEALTIQKP